MIISIITRLLSADGAAARGEPPDDPDRPALTWVDALVFAVVVACGAIPMIFLLY